MPVKSARELTIGDELEHPGQGQRRRHRVIIVLSRVINQRPRGRGHRQAVSEPDFAAGQRGDSMRLQTRSRPHVPAHEGQHHTVKRRVGQAPQPGGGRVAEQGVVAGGQQRRELEPERGQSRMANRVHAREDRLQ
jgi:hypothetical protein